MNPRVSAILIGNRVDVKDMRKVSYEEGRLLARIHRVQFIEVSAKLNYNVDEAFQILVSCIPDEYLIQVEPSGERGVNRKLKTVGTSVVCAVCRRVLRRHRDDPSLNLEVGNSPVMSQRHRDDPSLNVKLGNSPVTSQGEELEELERLRHERHSNGQHSVSRLGKYSTNRSMEELQPRGPEGHMRNSKSYFM